MKRTTPGFAPSSFRGILNVWENDTGWLVSWHFSSRSHDSRIWTYDLWIMGLEGCFQSVAPDGFICFQGTTAPTPSPFHHWSASTWLGTPFGILASVQPALYSRGHYAPSQFANCEPQSLFDWKKDPQRMEHSGKLWHFWHNLRRLSSRNPRHFCVVSTRLRKVVFCTDDMQVQKKRKKKKSIIRGVR